MKTFLLITCLFLNFLPGLNAQYLFTVDGTGVSKEEFLRAYNKNNTGAKPSEKAYNDYLELYIRYKLKVRAAYNMLLDTIPGQRMELQNFRAQVAENYLKDEASIDKLVNEVFTRGQKDIQLAHIYVALPKNAEAADTVRAYEKAMGAYDALKKGKKFAEVAALWSEDPSVRENGGSIGYITVFSLPYELESLAYSLAPGQFSKPYRSKGGYHIFRNLGERRSLGTMRAAQILVAFPPGTAGNARIAAKQKADSLYDALRKGADFGKLAASFSGDNLTYQSGGEMAVFGIGKYDSAFEAAAFGLSRDGAISTPVASAYGYHIIKRLERKDFPRQFTPEAAEDLKKQVMSDARIGISRKALFGRIYKQIELHRNSFSEAELWTFTDSAMLNTGLSSWRSLSFQTVLFSFARQQYTAKDWLDYARSARARQPVPGSRTNKGLFELFIERSALEYYRDHLEEYNSEFAFQLAEFREGNLLFEVMQRKIWEKASTDSAGLRNYFEGHKDKYWWEPSADVILFTCTNESAAQALHDRLLGDPGAWRTLSDSAGASVQTDSGRYEFAQIPGADKLTPATHMLTPLVTSKSDNTVSFAYVLQVYSERSPRNYRDARGFVINDYQAYLEDQWIADLKKKYPVKVDERMLSSLPK